MLFARLPLLKFRGVQFNFEKKNVLTFFFMGRDAVGVEIKQPSAAESCIKNLYIQIHMYKNFYIYKYILFIMHIQAFPVNSQQQLCTTKDVQTKIFFPL